MATNFVHYYSFLLPGGDFPVDERAISSWIYLRFLFSNFLIFYYFISHVQSLVPKEKQKELLSTPEYFLSFSIQDVQGQPVQPSPTNPTTTTNHIHTTTTTIQEDGVDGTTLRHRPFPI